MTEDEAIVMMSEIIFSENHSETLREAFQSKILDNQMMKESKKFLSLYKFFILLGLYTFFIFSFLFKVNKTENTVWFPGCAMRNSNAKQC